MIKMFTILWQIGVLSAILVFGIKIGLAMGFAGLSKKMAALITVGYGLGILILTMIASGYEETLNKVIYDYNFVIFLAMALVIIYAGLHTIKEWKVHQKNHAKASCMAMIAPCPCCFGAVVAAIILASPVIGASTFVIGKYAAVFLTLTIGIFYLASGAIVKITKKPYPVLLGNFMLFVGIYFLASALILPNINTVLAVKMSPLIIPSLSYFSYALLIMVALLVIGIYKTKKNSLLL